MVWMIEKKVFYYILDLGFERLKIPLRVKFEFEVQEGKLVDQSLSWQVLYNKKELRHHFPKLKWKQLEKSINRTVQKGIEAYLQQGGYLKQKFNDS
jgi:hypothetical protein